MLYSLLTTWRRSLTVATLAWAVGVSASAQTPIASPGTPIAQDFNTLPTSSTAVFAPNSTVPGWYADRTGTGNAIVAGTGSSNAGNLYSFGTGTDADRALGSVGSGNAAVGNFAYGWRLRNNTGGTITSLTVTFTGEQWRNSAAAAQTLDFSYLISGSEITTSSPGSPLPEGYVSNDEGDFTSPITGGTAGALNGNDPANRVTKTFTIGGLNVAAGQEIMLRWYDPDHAGADHGLSLDDVSVTANGSANPSPNLTATPTQLAGFTTPVGTPSAPQSYTLAGSNLTGPINVVAPASFQVSADGTTFADNLTLTPAGGSLSAVIRVRLTGTSTGSFNGTITHTLDGTSLASVTVSGTVTDPTTFATIAFARSQPNGTPISSLPGGKIAGRVTVSNQFGSTVYIQDGTGGIGVFSAALASAVQIGDSVQITGGIIDDFNLAKQIEGTVTFTNVGASPKGPLAPRPVAITELAAVEGQLVSVSSAVIRPNTLVDAPNPVFVLTPDANVVLRTDGGTSQLRVNRFTNIPGNTNPAGPATITGIASRFNQTVQLLPRFVADIPGTAPYVPAGGDIDRARTFDVATYNIEWLGNDPNGPTDEELQYQNAIRVLNSLQSDVIVLQEISAANAIDRLVAGMPGYGGNCSPFVSNNPGHEIPANPATPTTVPDDAQRVCVLYRTDVATLVSQQPLLERAAPLPGYPADPSDFWASGRYPYRWTFDVTAGGVTKRVNVVGVHAKANTAPIQTSYDRRKYDVRVLFDTLQAQYPNDLIVVTGDYNDDVDRTVANVPQTESTYQPFNDPAHFTVVTRPLSDNGFRSFLAQDNMIDHVAVSNELAPAYVAGTAGVATPYTFIANYGNTTSDHIPVFARFDLTKLVSPLALVAKAVPATICPNATAQVSVDVTGGTPPYRYSWTGPGTITNATSATATVSGLPVGPQSFTVTVTDAANQTKTATTLVTVEDKTAPVAKARKVVVQLNAQGQASVTPQQVDNGSSDDCSAITLSLSKTAFDCANVGANVVTLTVTDAGGNVATARDTVVVEDKLAPTARAKNVVAAVNAQGQVTVTPEQVNDGSSDNCGRLTFRLSKSVYNCSDIARPTSVTLTVTDASGNWATATATVTIEDRTAPTARTRNISVNLNAQGTITITPQQVNNGSTDNCQGNVRLSLDKTTFTCDNVGANVVSLTVTDANGNVATAPATVTVGPNAPAPNYRTRPGGSYPANQTDVTVNQNTGNVLFSADNCPGQLSWTGPDGQRGTGTIVVPTNRVGKFTYTGQCSFGPCPPKTTEVSVTVVAPASGRIGLPETGTTLTVDVLGNPVHDAIDVTVRGAAGQALLLHVTDMQGRSVARHRVEQANVVERLHVPVAGQPAGLLLLRVSTPTQTRTLKVLKQ